jgi:hypothetical protein
LWVPRVKEHRSPAAFGPPLESPRVCAIIGLSALLHERAPPVRLRVKPTAGLRLTNLRSRRQSEDQTQHEEGPDPDVHRTGVGRLVHQRDQALHDAFGGAEDRARHPRGHTSTTVAAFTPDLFLILTRHTPLGLPLFSTWIHFFG